MCLNKTKTEVQQPEWSLRRLNDTVRSAGVKRAFSRRPAATSGSARRRFL